MKNFLLFCLFPIIGLAQTQIGADINGEAADDRSGISVSLSADGSIVAIGADWNAGNGWNSGQVRIYKNIAGTWTQIGADIDGESSGNQSGMSVSLSTNGSIVAIGAPLNNSVGQARVFQNIAGVWTQIGANIAGEAWNDSFGYSVSLSADGNTVAIGAPQNAGNGADAGHARVYQNIAGTWTQIGVDIDGEAAGDSSGKYVSLSDDGSTVAVGAPNNDGNGSNSGHTRIYKNIAGTWTQIGTDIDGEAASNSSGSSISLSSDGSKVAIGAPFNSVNGIYSGNARIFQNIAGTWIQIGADIYGAAASDKFGGRISLSDDGSIVAIGAAENDGNGSNSGHVRVYKNIAGTWTQIGVNINGEATDDGSGSVSLSTDGSKIAIGAGGNDGNGSNSGHVRVYDLSALLASDSFVLTRFSIYPNPVSEMLNVSLQDNLTLEKVNIYNTLGQLIKTEKQNKINVSALSKGSYFVEVITSNGKATKTIVVE